MALVETINYGFRYLRRKKPALQDINLRIEPGEVVAVVGKAGAGKTTLVKGLMGIVPHIEPGYIDGELRIDGQSIRDREVSEMAHLVSIVLENPEVQIFSLTVKDDIAFGPANMGLPREEIWQRVNYAIREAELTGFEDRNPNNLSGGEQQSLAVASALAMKPKVLALDEPVSMLDPLGKERVMTIMERLAKSGTGAATIITESGADIEALADKVDRVIAMQNGHIQRQGGPEVLANEEMEELGVGCPQVSSLYHRLSKAGAYDGDIPITLDQAIEATRRLLTDSAVKKVTLPPNFGYARNHRTFGDPVVEVRNLKHLYPPNLMALKGVSLNVRAGQIVGIIGQNGSGKTTMARHLVGLLKPSNKDAKLDVLGHNVTRMKIRSIIRLINYVFQNADDQIFANTIREELAFAPEMMDLKPEVAEPLIEEAAKTFHLDGHENDYTMSLPEDLKTYLSIASIYSLKPQILLIDEPTTGLDTHGERLMMESLCHLRDLGHTLIIITHNMKTVSQYCDWVIVMNQGRVIMEGMPSAVLTVDEMAEILLHNLKR
jgi:energy-coupling factor transporter ATP-binding protein EcfA2